MNSDAARIRRRWKLFSLFGIAAWMGMTVYVGATNDDPSDNAPLRRAFAVGGAVFTAGILAFSALLWRSSWRRVNESLFSKLALGPVDEGAQRAVRRRIRRIGPVYFLFQAITGALGFVAIALGPEGPVNELAYTAFAIVGVAGVYGVYALRTVYRGAAVWLEPLGLKLTETPKWIPNLPGYGGGGYVVGELALMGRRHGRDVAISQTPRAALTAIRGSFAERALDDPRELSALAGEPAGSWRRVRVEAGPEGVTVYRRGSGAGAYMLQDLWLAERVAEGS